MLRVNTTILERFDALNRAALFLHEAIYAMDRRLNAAVDSVKTRAIVAHLFASGPINDSVARLISTTLDGPKTLLVPRGFPSPLEINFAYDPYEFGNVIQVEAEHKDDEGRTTVREERIGFNRWGNLRLKKMFPNATAGEIRIRITLKRASPAAIMSLWAVSGKTP